MEVLVDIVTNCTLRKDATSEYDDAHELLSEPMGAEPERACISLLGLGTEMYYPCLLLKNNAQGRYGSLFQVRWGGVNWRDLGQLSRHEWRRRCSLIQFIILDS
jgi:hypothetical protein